MLQISINSFKINFRSVLTILILNLTTLYLNAQPEARMPSEPGKCFAKCLIQDKFLTITDSFPIYSNIENIDYDIELIELHPSCQKWVTKKADKDCESDDPNDCLVWCLIDVEELTKEVKIPINPSLAGELSYEVYESKKLISKGGWTEWREVVCGKDVTKDLVKKVQFALVEKGYLGETGINNILGKETKAALVLFQKENELPVGQLDFETLASLGIISKK